MGTITPYKVPKITQHTTYYLSRKRLREHIKLLTIHYSKKKPSFNVYKIDQNIRNPFHNYVSNSHFDGFLNLIVRDHIGFPHDVLRRTGHHRRLITLRTHRADRVL